MDGEKSLNLDLDVDPISSKRVAANDDGDLIDLQVKKPRRGEGNSRDLVVVELDQDSKENQPDYFEFIKTTTADEFNQAIAGGIQSKTSPGTNTSSNDSDRDLTDAQQYFIAVDARTVATLQAGAEYTLVPIDQNGKDTPEEERDSNFDEDGCRMWNENDEPLKENDRPQQLLIQTMRPISSNQSSPQIFCHDDGSGGQGSDTEGLETPSSVYSNVDETISPTRKTRQTNNRAQNLVRASTVKFDTSNRFQNPNTNSPTTFPVLPQPHIMYNVPGPSHHPSPSTPFGFAGHRVHLPPPGSSWHTSPYTQNFSPHQNQNFVPSQTITSTSAMNLNSSGEEQENVSPEYSRVAQSTSGGGEGNLFPISAIQRTTNMAQILGPLDNMQYFPIPYTGRENHNEKERKRRSRIKNACSLLRDLVPGLSEKTDKATVFEYTVQYLLHLKRHVGKQFDKEFMEKYTPY